MKLKSLLCSTICTFLLNGTATGETVFVASEGNACTVLHIQSVYQIGSEIAVTTGIEDIFDICVGMDVISASLTMSYPSIALKEINRFNYEGEDWLLLYRNGQFLNSYDPELGTGWVDSPVLGSIFIRPYPWVYHPELGWLLVVEGPIINQSELSFWFHSPEYGWLWKKPSMDVIYHQESDTFAPISGVGSIGKVFNLAFNQEVTVRDGELRIRFTEVNEDSRCPVDVICFWAGRLVVTLTVNDQNLQLSIGGRSEPSKTIDGYRINLTEVVAPVPRSDEVPQDSDYVIALRVDKVP